MPREIKINPGKIADSLTKAICSPAGYAFWGFSFALFIVFWVIPFVTQGTSSTPTTFPTCDSPFVEKMVADMYKEKGIKFNEFMEVEQYDDATNPKTGQRVKNCLAMVITSAGISTVQMLIFKTTKSYYVYLEPIDGSMYEQMKALPMDKR